MQQQRHTMSGGLSMHNTSCWVQGLSIVIESSDEADLRAVQCRHSWALQAATWSCLGPSGRAGCGRITTQQLRIKRTITSTISSAV